MTDTVADQVADDAVAVLLERAFDGRADVTGANLVVDGSDAGVQGFFGSFDQLDWRCCLGCRQ